MALLAGVIGSPIGHAADFAGGGIGPIPDNNASGINITFNVSGITPAVGSVRLRLGLTHSFAGDIVATLRSPGGVSTLLVFGRVGLGLGYPTPTVGTPANFAGVYEFSDDASLDLWAVTTPLTTVTNIPTRKYRTSGLGVVNTRHGGCSTSLAGAFNGLAGAEVNGTWTLNVSDRATSDTGSVTSALLSISESPDLFASGFEDPPHGDCQAARFDYTGSGRSSYATLRNTSGSAGGAITWTIQDNDGTISGAQQSFVFGLATDNFTDSDIDGDGIADPTVWRAASGPGSPAQFLVRRSSRPGAAPVIIDFGLGGDDPTHSGDYDGDGIGDLAVFRPGTAAGAASRTLIRLSDGTIRNLVTGETGSYANSGIDYTGNGKADIAIQANAGGGVASFRIFEGTNGGLIQSFNFGTTGDLIVLGNHTGSAVGDITVVRGSAGMINWSTRDTQTGIVQPTVILGVSASDFALSGDYDGDGLDDYAVWRPSATPGASRFVVRPSSATATTINVPLGLSGDYPIANSRTH